MIGYDVLGFINVPWVNVIRLHNKVSVIGLHLPQFLMYGHVIHGKEKDGYCYDYSCYFLHVFLWLRLEKHCANAPGCRNRLGSLNSLFLISFEAYHFPERAEYGRSNIHCQDHIC